MKPQHFLALAFAQVLWGANFAVLKLGLDTWPPIFFVAYNDRRGRRRI